MMKLVIPPFCDRNGSLCTVGQRRKIRLRGNAGLFAVHAISARNGAARAQFREPLSCELCADNGDIFRRFAIASKYASKITAFPVSVWLSPKRERPLCRAKVFLQYMR